jgi:hypothetical protein
VIQQSCEKDGIHGTHVFSVEICPKWISQVPKIIQCNINHLHYEHDEWPPHTFYGCHDILWKCTFKKLRKPYSKDCYIKFQIIHTFTKTPWLGGKILELCNLF